MILRLTAFLALALLATYMELVSKKISRVIPKLNQFPA